MKKILNFRGAILCLIVSLSVAVVAGGLGLFKFNPVAVTEAAGNSSGKQYLVTASITSGSNVQDPRISQLNVISSSPSNQTQIRINDFQQSVPSEIVQDKYVVQLSEIPLAVKYAELKANDPKPRPTPGPRSTKISSEMVGALKDQKSKVINQQITFYSNLPESVRSKNPSLREAIVSDTGNKAFNTVLNAVVVNMDASEAVNVARIQGVKKVEQVKAVHADLMDSVPLINADDAWSGNYVDGSSDSPITGRGIRIAIIDTGVDYTHPDLGGCFGTGCRVVDGYNFADDKPDPMDDQGHGTHVADIAAGSGTPKGVAPEASIYAYKVLNSWGSGTTATIIAGLERAMDPNQNGNLAEHVDVANLSLGGDGNPDDPMSVAVDNAVNAGVVMVVAAGNSGPSINTIGSPGTARGAITVAATDKQDNVASFSSRGPVIWLKSNGAVGYLAKPDVSAPGVKICASQWGDAFSSQGDTNCNKDDSHVAISGTSMATPHVAGEVALLLQLHPDWSPTEVKAAVRNAVTDSTSCLLRFFFCSSSPYSQYDWGFGRVDVKKLLESEMLPIAKLISIDKVGTNLIVKGTAISRTSAISYTLSYGKGEKPSSFTDIFTSNDSVNNSVLYSNFDSSILDNGMYLFKLDVMDADGNKSLDVIPFNVDRQMLSGWPLHLIKFDSIESLVPAFEDIDNDGTQDVVIHSSIREYAYSGDGVPVSGWPTYLHPPAALSNAQWTNSASWDVDKDGRNEVVVSSRDYYLSKNDPNSYSYCFMIFDEDGTFAKGWPKKCDSVSNFNATTPAKIVDLDGDGISEIVNFTWPNSSESRIVIKVLQADGTDYKGWPITLDGYVIDSFSTGFAIADTDGDGKKEIIAILQKERLSSGFSSGSYSLFIWNNDGSTRKGYPMVLPQLNYDAKVANSVQTTGGPIVSDINGDGKLEIGMIQARGNCYQNDGKIIYLNLDGSTTRNWPASFSNQFIAPSITVADLNNDGKVETIFGTTGACTDKSGYNVYVFNDNGTVRSGWPQNILGGVWSQATASDIDGDGYAEVLVSTDIGKIYAWTKDGKLISGFPKQMSGGSKSGVAVGSISGNGKVDIVSSTINGDIFAWEINTPYRSSIMDWPTYLRDSQHSGCVNCTAKSSTVISTSTTAISTSTVAQSVTPNKEKIMSGEAVTLNYVVLKGAVSTSLMLYCPNGVKASFGKSDNMCNQWVTLGQKPSSTTFVLSSTANWPQYVIPNFYVYYENDPNFAIGVTSQITILPAPKATNTPSANPSATSTGLIGRVVTGVQSILTSTVRTITSIIRPSSSPTPVTTATPVTSPSITPRISPSISPSVSPRTSPTISPSPSPSISPRVSPASTAQPSVTSSPSSTPRPSSTPTPTISPTTSPSPSITATPSPTPFITPTPSPTSVVTSTPSATPVATSTPSPTPSLSPSPSTSPTPVPTVTPAPSSSPTPSPFSYLRKTRTANTFEAYLRMIGIIR